MIGIGQTTHSITSRMTIWSAGYKVRSITPLEEEAALSRGADIVGESFVLVVTAGTMVWEYNRSKEKEKQKEEKQRAEAKAERQALQDNFKALDARLQAVEEVVKYNSESLLNIAGKRYVEPKRKKLIQIADDDETSNESAMTRRVEERLEHDENMKAPKEGTESGGANSKSWWKFW